MTITGLAHVNLVVPAGTLASAKVFYGTTLGLSAAPVPAAIRDRIVWFDIAGSPGQQIHIAPGRDSEFETLAAKSSRHPCFRIGGGPEGLLALQRHIWQHFCEGGDGAPRECDEPGKENSGTKGEEFPTRFFARDYAGNRLEFSL